MTYDLSSYKLAQNNSVMTHSNFNGLWEEVYGDSQAGLVEIYENYCLYDGSEQAEHMGIKLATKPNKANRATLSANEWNANVDNLQNILTEFIDHSSNVTSSKVNTWVANLLPNRQKGNQITVTQWNKMVDDLQSMLNTLQADIDEKEAIYNAWKFGDQMPIILS